jgi:hypothetical protein
MLNGCKNTSCAWWSWIAPDPAQIEGGKAVILDQGCDSAEVQMVMRREPDPNSPNCPCFEEIGGEDDEDEFFDDIPLERELAL